MTSPDNMVPWDATISFSLKLNYAHTAVYMFMIAKDRIFSISRSHYPIVTLREAVC